MDKVMIVTGGGRGIGAATARLAAKRGFAVCINYLRDRASAENLKQEIEKNGGKAIAVQGDIAAEADILNLFQQTDRALGRVTALVNNAGIVDRTTPVDHIPPAPLPPIFPITATGTFLSAP